MVKPEWGSKRICPKCSTRFYDLTKDEDLEAEELAIDEDEEPSADDEVDLATDDDDLGVAKTDDDEDS